MFPISDNNSELKGVKSVLDFNWSSVLDQLPSTACIPEALKLCFECSNCIFNNRHFP